MTTATVPIDLVADLERRGVTVRRNGDKLRVAPVAKVHEDEIETLRRHRDAILEALDTWNEPLARRRLEAAWRWADEATPAGCWAALPDDVWTDLEAALDEAYDVIDAAFHDEDPAAFEAGLRRFRNVVEAAVAEYEQDGDELLRWFDEEEER